MATAQAMTFIQKVMRYFREAYCSGHFPPLRALLKNRHRILAYHGFLGDGNFGDELVYEAAQSLFHDCLLIPMKRHMPLITRFLLKTGCLAVRGEILGGGTLIGPRVELSSDANSTFVHGTGVKGSYSDDWIGVLGSRTVFGGVRGRASQQRLADRGCTVEIDGDAAFKFFREGNMSCNKFDTVLVNFGTHNAESKLVRSRGEICAFIVDLLERGMLVEFLPFHHVDERLGEDLVKEFSEIKLHGIPSNFASAAAVFQNASFAVGERLHFTVMALLCGCPCFSVMYEPKHEELLHSLDSLGCGVLPDAVAYSIIYAHHARRNDFDWTAVRQKLSAYKHKQETDARAFLKHVGIGT